MEGAALLPLVKGIVEMGIFLQNRRGAPRVHFFFFLIFQGLIFAVPSGRAQEGYTGSTLARCSWDPPTYGTPVHHYILQVVNVTYDPDTPVVYDNIMDEYLDVPVLFTNTYKARVAGVDSLGRQGPWSQWTPLYEPDEVPGEGQ